MVIRHAKDGKMYLYDLMNIKKRNEHPFPVRRHYSVKNPFLNLQLYSDSIKKSIKRNKHQFWEE